jgi:hypothetical protein
MTGGAHGGDVAEAVSPLLSAKASVVAAAGYTLERRGDIGPTFGGGKERRRNGNGMAFRLA